LISYPAIVHSDPDGFWIEFPDLKGCVTEGDSYEDLLKNAEEALSLYLEDFIDNEKHLPLPTTVEQASSETVVFVEVSPEIGIPLLIKKIRQELNLTQMEVAERMGIKYQTYQQIESIKKFNATVKTLRNVGKALNKKLVIDLQ
jgi:antitoxin HicB